MTRITFSDINSGWLNNCRQLVSTNCDIRPDPEDINLLVVHSISLPAGEFATGYIEQLFTNCLDCQCHPSFTDLQGLKVSAHFLIDRNGAITQFVPLHLRAWHAGVSEFNGRSQCNDYSIGIELEGCDNLAYSEQQYRSLSLLIAQIQQRYPAITANRIVGHSDVAPTRKTDPGPAFNWSYLHQLLEQQ